MVGYGFNSIGRFAQSGILRDRFVPRIMAAPTEQLFDGASSTARPSIALRCSTRSLAVMATGRERWGPGARLLGPQCETRR